MKVPICTLDPLGTKVYHEGTNVHPLGTKLYLLKRYRPSDSFRTFFLTVNVAAVFFFIFFFQIYYISDTRALKHCFVLPFTLKKHLGLNLRFMYLNKYMHFPFICMTQFWHKLIVMHTQVKQVHLTFNTHSLLRNMHLFDFNCLFHCFFQLKSINVVEIWLAKQYSKIAH